MTNKNSVWDFFHEDENQKKTMLGKIKEIGEMALEQKNWAEVAEQNCEKLSQFSKYLGTNEFQTATFLAVFYYTYFAGEYSVGPRELAEFFATKQIMIMAHKKEIMQMQRLGIMRIRVRKRSRHVFGNNDEENPSFNGLEFVIPESVVQSIMDEKELKKDDLVETPKDFLLKFNKILDYSESDEFFDIYEEVDSLELDVEQSISEIGKVKSKIPCLSDRILFYAVCTDSLFSRRATCFLSERLAQILESSYDQTERLKVLVSEDEEEQHELVKDKLIEINEAKMAEDATANVTNEGLELMFGESAIIYKSKISNVDVIESEKIVQKELFFTGSTEEQLSRIRSALDEKRFNEIQERLGKKGMCRGIAALLYGAPGTGKTESVYQMAKETGRNIYHVDISQTKTKWYGESPKLVKKIFSRYKDMCKEARNENKKIPILLLNEADALISVRQDVSGDAGSCDREDNTIQNVVLEQMETFEGILIATTNLATNMDAAFERRFLFKVEFKKPDADGRAKIWKSKIKALNDDDAKEIAADYDFSGGEIDNISRKMELEEVISGVIPDVKKIRELCRTEKIATGSCDRMIGFAS